MLMPKRIYFETTETITKNSKGWIEVDTDFTQVYDCFSRVCVHLKSITTMKLLFWLLSHEANKSNGISSGRIVFERFSKFLEEEKEDTVTERTFQNCFEELTKNQILTRIGKGHYYFSPYVFWRDDKTNRIDFITNEAKEKKYISHNPLKIEQKINK